MTSDMDSNRVGNSTHRPPLLDCTNYSYWKARMRAILKSIDEKVWHCVIYGWSEPVVTIDGVDIAKPLDKWDAFDYQNYSWNSKALNSLFFSVTPKEFRRIWQKRLGTFLKRFTKVLLQSKGQNFNVSPPL